MVNGQKVDACLQTKSNMEGSVTSHSTHAISLHKLIKGWLYSKFYLGICSSRQEPCHVRPSSLFLQPAEDMAVSLETDQLKSQKDPLHLNCMVLQGFTMLDYGSLTLNLFHLPRCRGMLGHAVFCLFLRACRKRWKMAVASSWDLLRASVTARPSMRAQLRQDSGRPFRHQSHVAISSMLVNQLLYGCHVLDSMGCHLSQTMAPGSPWSSRSCQVAICRLCT